jgi:hypothetical protein
LSAGFDQDDVVQVELPPGEYSIDFAPIEDEFVGSYYRFKARNAANAT